MWEKANRSGFCTDSSEYLAAHAKAKGQRDAGRAGESPSAQAVRDIVSGDPCRYCLVNGEWSDKVTREDVDNCSKYLPYNVYKRHNGHYSIVEQVCRKGWERSNRHSKTLVLEDRYGKTIIKALED